MQLLNKAVVDGKNINISFDVVLQSGGSVIDVMLHFPHFSSSLEFDPDFSVVLAGDKNNNGRDGGSTNNDQETKDRSEGSSGVTQHRNRPQPVTALRTFQYKRLAWTFSSACSTVVMPLHEAIK